MPHWHASHCFRMRPLLFITSARSRERGHRLPCRFCLPPPGDSVNTVAYLLACSLRPASFSRFSAPPRASRTNF
ncbi:hypothetical protein [Methanimicrococcus hacksteinii]|uniref:hypothetical protein n=1 Tax=Methanimicrococcus hacksteinii TaxID=3028293 RepID=UPI00298F1767|nr:hypothetical protein [Methanimicrococcus sp. At1]